ncbi:MAG: hypothetical protein HQK71_00615 [Desulfamplus sp.]|nr:hypothetical protein [Desulfamplus sp.]
MVDVATVQPYQQPMQLQQPMQQYQQVQPYQQQQMRPQTFSNGIASQPNTSISGQYVCPVHGAVGLPQFNASGAPVCPLGDNIMQFHATTGGTATNSAPIGNLALAAGG